MVNFIKVINSLAYLMILISLSPVVTPRCCFLIKISFVVTFLLQTEEQILFFSVAKTICYYGNHFKVAYAISHNSNPKWSPQCTHRSSCAESQDLTVRFQSKYKTCDLSSEIKLLAGLCVLGSSVKAVFWRLSFKALKSISTFCYMEIHEGGTVRFKMQNVILHYILVTDSCVLGGFS